MGIFMAMLSLEVLFHPLCSIKNGSKALPLYFWDARPTLGFSNFGDALSEALVNRMVDMEVEITKNPLLSRQKLLGIGSILAM